jgi:hypothetical protein
MRSCEWVTKVTVPEWKGGHRLLVTGQTKLLVLIHKLYKIVMFDEVYILYHFNIIVGSHNYMSLQYHLSSYWSLHSGYSQKLSLLCFWIKTPIIRIIFVTYYSQPVCISFLIVLQVLWFKMKCATGIHILPLLLFSCIWWRIFCLM